MTTEAASLFVKVTGDISDAHQKLGTIGQDAQKSGGFFKGAAQQAIGFGAAMAGFAAAQGAVSLVTSSVFGMNAQLETSTLQFETLMGSSEKATQKVADLFEFAKKTPFETQPIIEASRIMQTFGGDALNSNDNLRLFGDAAAATAQPINDIAFWMSRAYAAIQGGQPFGEARMRLMEMGVLSPQVASQLEELGKSGASASDQWAALSGSLDRFGGAMEKQAGTFDGLVSTFTDSLHMAIATGLKPLFNALKDALGGVVDFMSSDMFNGTVERIGKGIADAFTLIATGVGKVLEFLSPLTSAFGYVFDLFDAGAEGADGFGEVLGNLGEVLGTMGLQIQDAIFGALTSVLEQIPAMTDAFFQFVTGAVNGIIAAAPTFLAAWLALIQNALDWVMNEGVPLAAQALANFAEEFIAWVGPAAERLANALPGMAEKVLAFIGENAPKIAGKLVEWAGAFLGWVGEHVLPKLPGMLYDVAVAIGSWLLGVKDTIVAKAVEIGKGFVNNVVDWVKTLPDKLRELVGNLAQAGMDLAVALGKGFANALVGLVEGAINTVLRAINSIHFTIGAFDIGPVHFAGFTFSGFHIPLVSLPRFEKGAWDVGRQSFPAILDPHEMVLPAALAERIRAGGLGGAAPEVIQTIVNVEVGQFYGYESRAIDELAEKIGQRVRATTVRRSQFGTTG